MYFKNTLAILFTITSSLLLLACSAKNDDEPKEVIPKGQALLTSDAPEDVLLDTAQTLYMSGLYSVAKDSFQSLYTTYPLGSYVEYAKIKSADCSFLMSEYENAAAEYESFIKDHPSHSALDYITYRAGLSHYYNNKGVGRDIAPLENAYKFFEKTESSYPQSAFAKSASYYKSQTQKKLAKHNQKVLNFYRSRGNDAAYTNRKKEFENQWSKVLKETTNWPSAKSRPLTLAEADQNNWKKNFLTVANSQSDSVYQRSALRTSPVEIDGILRLQAVKCNSGRDSQIALYFNERKESSELLETFTYNSPIVTPQNGVIQLAIPNLGGEVREYNCLSGHKISFNSNGVLEISSNFAWELFYVENPTRLILVPQ